MQLEEHWSTIKQVISQGQASAIHCSIASVAPDGTPNVTPIGTVFLRDDFTGYYFDRYTSALASNLDGNPNVCVMAVNTSRWFWFKSLLLGEFASPPGVRLYGTAGALREATREEIQRVEARIGVTKRLKGGRLLWSSFTHVRDITFTAFRPVLYPKMMERLWKASV